MAMSTDLVGRRFAGKLALVTAGAGAIGSAIVRRFVAEGARVVVWDIDEARMRQLTAEPDLAAQVDWALVDVTDAAAVESAAAALAAADGRPLQVLVNNAGGARSASTSLLGETDAVLAATLNANVMSVARVTRQFAPRMIEAGYGRIVNVGSKAGRYGSYIDGPAYVAAKGAVHALTLAMAMEFGPAGITCNCVCPGIILSAKVKAIWERVRSPEEREQIRKPIPLRRHGREEEVAGAIAFLASDDASFITGSNLDVNGGQVITT